jgi:hypothetical protein
MKPYICIFLMAFVACTAQQVQTPPVTQEAPGSKQKEEPEAKSPSQDSPLAKKEKKEEVSGSPMGRAIETIDKATQEMADTIKVIKQLQTGDYIFACQNQQERGRAFNTMRSFFGAKIFDFDDFTFWFLAADGKKVGLNENEGIIHKCTVGMFESFKRVVVVQFNKDETVQTEFYMDGKTGDLMVHRYHGHRRTNENYKLAGY